MRISLSELKGVWIKYKDSARPVEVIERVQYSFQSDSRECLVKIPDHVRQLLTTGRYYINGIEFDLPERVSEHPVPLEPIRRRGRPPKHESH